MAHTFDDEALAGVLRHMNADHADDNLLIARAFGTVPEPSAARMAGFDGDGGDWVVARADGGEEPLRVPWPGGPITERGEVRREIVALYDAACARLGAPPRARS
ncbi:MAG: DUF2470 domain-containing protein [Microbacterium sp.]